MKTQFQKLIEILRKHVLQNLELIKANEIQIKATLSEPESMERSDKLSCFYDQNKLLLTENNDFINLQVDMLNLMNKHRQSIEANNIPTEPIKKELQLPQTMTRDDYFRLTLEEDLPYDHRHPYFNDPEFYKDLLDYLEDEENYELCAKLVSMKKQLI